MKKLIVGLVFAMAAVAFAVTPATADIKVTTKGYFQVQGMYLSGLPLKVDGYEGSNNWYNMEMVLEPTMHVNDKVRIHAQIRMMERNYSGTAAGDKYATEANQSKYNVFGDKQNNFWLERLYTSFNIWGGTMSIGRMSGGNWANDFGDSDENRDRILYVRRFGPFTLLGLIEKRDENDGGLTPTRLNNVTNFNNSLVNYKTVDEDQDAYAIGAVLPFSKNIILRPLWYGIRDGRGWPTGTEPNWHHVMMLGGIYKFGPVGFEHEIDYWYGSSEGEGSLDYNQWAIWAGVNFAAGPLTLALNGFWIEGGDHQADSKDRTGYYSTGQRFQPLLLLFSEDMGFLWATSGVPNASADPSQSGYVCLYMPVSFKISDAMKIGGVLGYLRADTMNRGSKYDGGTANKELGWEIDLNFTWKFMDNISYIFDGGVFFPGNYWKDAYTQGGKVLDDRTVYGVRNGIKIEW